MNYYYEDLLGYTRNPRRRNADYSHKDQLNFYGLEGNDDEFRICYRFRKDTVRVLCETLGCEFAPKSGANKAFTVEQRLCIALRYYATGTFQRQIGNSEGASQSSSQRIIRKVSQVLASHVPVVIQFSTDPDVFKSVSEGFYAFKGSELLVLYMWCCKNCFVNVLCKFKMTQNFFTFYLQNCHSVLGQ